MNIATAIGIVSLILVYGCSPDPGSAVTPQATTTEGGQAAVAPTVPRETAAGFFVEQIWTTERISGRSPAGVIEVTPDPGHVLIVLDVTARGESPVTVDVDQLGATGAGGPVDPIGAAPVSLSSFAAFSGFLSGWKIVTDAEERVVKIGRDAEGQPIELTVAPGAKVSIVYIVPEGGPPMIVSLPGAGDVPLVPSP